MGGCFGDAVDLQGELLFGEDVLESFCVSVSQILLLPPGAYERKLQVTTNRIKSSNRSNASREFVYLVSTAFLLAVLVCPTSYPSHLCVVVNKHSLLL